MKTFPYFDETIVFSENLPEFFKREIEKLKDAWKRKDIFDFIFLVDEIEPLIKNAYFLHRVSKDDLEKFFIMCGRDWWNRSERFVEKKKRRINTCLLNF